MLGDMIFLGIDPGVSGGIAALRSVQEPAFCRLDLDKVTERDIADFLTDAAPHHWGCVIERVGPCRGDAQRRQGASSMFTFGKGYGFLRGLLIALEIRFVEVAPSKWPAEFGLRREKNESATVTKNRNKAKAQQLYPTVDVPHWKADALLLATYCQRRAKELF